MHVKGKQAVLQKLGFEVRYDFGFTYLDKCGRTINTILHESPEWMIKGDHPNPQEGSMVSIRNGCTFSFSPYSYNFNLEMPKGGKPLDENDVSDFIEQADEISQVINNSLALNVFKRIGVKSVASF